MISPSKTPAALPHATSVLLDLLRLAAASTVFGIHCRLVWFGASDEAMHFAHLSVIVFFVLSGYVIAYSTFRKKRGIRAYAVARLSRLYSVAAPALVLTLFLDLLGRHLNPAFYLAYSHGHEPVRYLATAGFLQSFWLSQLSPSTNPPFWSLGYEFWYYVLFGVTFLLRSWKTKFLLLAALSLAMGPGILLLLPCWLIGAGLYAYGNRQCLPFRWALGGFLLSCLLLALIYQALPPIPLVAGLRPLLFSNAFVSDTIFALVLAGTIWLFGQAFSSLVIPAQWVETVRFWADHTFSLYLYHFPLLVFLRATVPIEQLAPWQVGGGIALVLLVIFLLSLFTESKRPAWGRFFAWTGEKIKLEYMSRMI